MVEHFKCRWKTVVETISSDNEIEGITSKQTDNWQDMKNDWRLLENGKMTKIDQNVSSSK